MNTTTVGALTEAIEAAIIEVTPSEEQFRARPWTSVDDRDSVSGGEIRTFFAELVDVAPVRDGIYSPSAIEHAATLLVWTCYPNIPRRKYTALVGEDGRQVWVVLDIKRDATTAGTIDGLISVEHVAWQEQDDEQGRFWGAHPYQVRFLAQGLP